MLWYSCLVNPYIILEFGDVQILEIRLSHDTESFNPSAMKEKQKEVCEANLVSGASSGPGTADVGNPAFKK